MPDISQSSRPNKLRKPQRVHHPPPTRVHQQPLFEALTFTDRNLDLSLGPSSFRELHNVSDASSLAHVPGPPLETNCIPATRTAHTSSTPRHPHSHPHPSVSHPHSPPHPHPPLGIPPSSPSRPLHSSPLTSHSIFTSSNIGPSFSSSRSNASLSRSNTSTSSRKLTKRRPSILATIPQAQPIPPSSSSEAAYAASRALSSEYPSFPMSHTPPSYTQSDIGHGSTTLTPKRGSIIRRFSMLTKKQALDSASSPASASTPWPESQSAARAKWTRWKKSKGRQTDSEQAHENSSLPLLRVVSPFAVSMPEQSHQHSGSWGNGSTILQPSSQEDDPGFSPPFSTVDPLLLMPPSSPPATSSSDPEQELPPLRSRPKFTLSNDSDADLSSDHQHSASSSFSRPPPRPRLIRRDAKVGTVGYGTQRRRWTLAMAMTDEEITDEVLVEELERVVLQMRSHWTGSLEDLPAGFGIWDADMGREIWESSLQSYLGRDGDASDAGHSAETGAWNDRDIIHESPTSESGLPTGAKIPFTPSLPSFPLQHRLSTPAPASSATWQTARRALLTCRELVRTERHYLTSLQGLLASETLTPPPPLMLHYAGELAKVSEGLLGRMEENPSAWGVAAAFLGTEEGVESTFVSWCGVVGTWFADDEKADADRGRGSSSRSASRKSSPVRRKLSKPSVIEDKDKKPEGEDEGTLMSPLLRTVSTWRKSMPSITSLDSSKGSYHSGSQLSSPHFLSKRKEKERERMLSAPSEAAPTTQGTSKRKPAVRDLAILPTQRVMRYVLLYRDLLAHTPSTSPSRALVERAVEAACRIAQKCDRAQGNAVFFSGTAPKADKPASKVASSSSNISVNAHPSSRRKLTLSMTPVSSRPRADQNAEL